MATRCQNPPNFASFFFISKYLKVQVDDATNLKFFLRIFKSHNIAL